MLAGMRRVGLQVIVLIGALLAANSECVLACLTGGCHDAAGIGQSTAEEHGPGCHDHAPSQPAHTVRCTHPAFVAEVPGELDSAPLRMFVGESTAPAENGRFAAPGLFATRIQGVLSPPVLFKPALSTVLKV